MAIQHLDDTESPKAAIDSLFKSQKYVAKLMEISFYIIGDFPELFSEVMWRMNWIGLISKFDTICAQDILEWFESI